MTPALMPRIIDPAQYNRDYQSSKWRSDPTFRERKQKRDRERRAALKLEHEKALLQIGKKPCADCGQDKALSDFGPHPSTVDGLQPNCRPCASYIRRVNQLAAIDIKALKSSTPSPEAQRAALAKLRLEKELRERGLLRPYTGTLTGARNLPIPSIRKAA